jgi:DNA-binding MarR family transcriptional regulator
MRAEEELRFLILAAQREGSRSFSAALAPLELTPAQAEVIRCLADAGPISLRTLGEMLVCESGSPSRLVDSLVGRELVERREDSRDRRSVVLKLTAVGARLDRAVRKVEDALYDGIARQLNSEAIRAALELLRPVVAGTIAGDAIARRKAIKPKL